MGKDYVFFTLLYIMRARVCEMLDKEKGERE